MEKKNGTERKYKRRAVGNVIMVLMLGAVVYLCAFGIASTLKNLQVGADLTLDQINTAKNMTFPSNETTRNAANIGFTMLLSVGSTAILFLGGFIILCWFSMPYFLRGAWNAWKKRPTLEERVEALEKAIGEKG